MKREYLWGGIVVAGVLILVWTAVVFFGNPLPTEANLAERMDLGLAELETVQGRLTFSQGEATLTQELWVARPSSLRMEIEAGPAGMGPVGFKKTTLVLNPQEAWFYNPNLELVTVAARGGLDDPDTESILENSLLETLPDDVRTAVEQGESLQVVGREEVAGRPALHVQLTLPEAVNFLPPGPLSLWLDQEFFYPLALRSEAGLSLRFELILFNREVDPAAFVFVPPPGSTVHRVEP